MKYFLDKVSDSFLDRVVLDFSYGVNVSKRIKYLIDNDMFSRACAISKSKDSYLCVFSEVVRGDDFLQSYLYVLRDVSVVLNKLNAFGNDFAISSVNRELLDKNFFLENISLAFEEYGFFGDGVYDESGCPEFRVAPHFIGI